MPNQSIFEIANGGYDEIPADWMPATQVRSFILNDPAVVWLEYYGKQHGFQPDTSPYDFTNFIFEKGRQLEQKWIREITPTAVGVCQRADEVRLLERFRQTFDLIQEETPVIYQPALWWAPERIYGVPDLLIHTSCLQEHFPDLLQYTPSSNVTTNAENSDSTGHYVVFDIKFTTELESSNKKDKYQIYAAQVRIYSYILGHLQSYMPNNSFLVTRDRLTDPIPVRIVSHLNQPLDDDLRTIRDHFLDIRQNGENYLPWRDEIVECNIKESEDRWQSAKLEIAQERVPGKDPALLYQISHSRKKELLAMDFPSLDSLMIEDLQQIPLENVKRVGKKTADRIRAILQVNRSGSPLVPCVDLVPQRKPFEFYVDYEYFTNVNVDFEKQWPGLEGCEMIFMIGVGWNDDGLWHFRHFSAMEENWDHEYQMLNEFLDFLKAQTNGGVFDDSKTALYHWTAAEVWQSSRAADRHKLPDDHLLRKFPWCDLQKVFHDTPCAIPGAWGFGLKEIAKSLGKLESDYDPNWPGDLDEGLQAMVMGWHAYKTASPLESQEMVTLSQYLEADCKALWNILRWMRANPNSSA